MVSKSAVQQSNGLWKEAVEQSGGCFLTLRYLLPDESSFSTRSTFIALSPKAALEEILDGWNGHSNDPLISPHHPPQGPLVCYVAAGVPHRVAIYQYTLIHAPVECCKDAGGV